MNRRTGRPPATRAGLAMLRKLCVRSIFTDAERDALLALPVDETDFASRETIVHEGDAVERSCVLVDGYAARYKFLPDRSCQIVAIHIAGDVIDLHSSVLKVADHSIVALGQARIAFLPHEAVLRTANCFPTIARAFWRETMVEGAIGREWLLNVGQRNAYGRLAHLLCEMRLRMEAVGLSRDDRFPLPITQAELGKATAMTSVHVNRMMQKLRADRLISTRGTEVRVENRDGLAEAGTFSPTYLYLPQ